MRVYFVKRIIKFNAVVHVILMKMVEQSLLEIVSSVFFASPRKTETMTPRDEVKLTPTTFYKLYKQLHRAGKPLACNTFFIL